MGWLYEFWFELIKDGQYLWEIEKMHDKYGPIVRVNARELHIRDSQFYSTIYTAGGRKVDKDAATVRAFGVPSSVIATVDHNHHRARLGYISAYFSRRSVISMETMMHERIGKLCHRLQTCIKTGEVVTLDSAFSALTADIITQRFYGEHLNYLNIPDYKMAVTEAALGVTLAFHLGRLIPGLVSALKKMPIWLLQIIFPPVADLLVLQQSLKHNILSSLDDDARKKDSKSIIIQALNDPNIPLPEREIDRLIDESTAFILAGTETTSRALSVGMLHLLTDKTHLKKLRVELSALASKPDNDYSMSQLEALPYLTGVVHESMRLAFGPVSRLPRVATHESLHYGGFTIPPGTPVSQSTYFVHTDPTIYPHPHCFDPDRWTRAAQDRFPLNKFLVNFTKGSRQCLGVQMAFTELYITIARLVGNFDMDLHETTIEDVKLHRAHLFGYPKKAANTANVRGEIMVKVTGRANEGRIGAVLKAET
ncbi:cytochrome p450 [Hirsutella rhossiliensis]|uniref:Cytochrome p450 domain-containing protein n=1 Tax=Hirsutella rhossiliensis TaxID=111463 RepID=A0A9P8MUN0_9HYPO|nr:cytochrome p450 domain-containing protein [Hirsutella rhossiliensis]KAH0961464.1 cytochrome p450 domain-containing protein [Hirsutella rhossiliensis]